MTDKEFNDAFTAAGGTFLSYYGETVLDWTGSTADLVDFLYAKGHDKNITGTRARVSAIRRLINEDCFADALKKVCNSRNIGRDHPGACQLASDLLRRRFPDR